MKKTLIALMMAAAAAWAGMSVDEIVHNVDTRDDGDNIVSEMQMILIDKHQNIRQRKLKSFKKDFGPDTYSAVFFLEPSDVRNTAFLTYDYDDAAKDDDQWLYLPALKKSKRISSTDKSGSFMGSDFSYSDMTNRDIEDYTYKMVKEQEVDGQNVWVIETTPKTQEIIDETGYTKSYMFVRQDNFVVVRAIHMLDEGEKRKYMEVKRLEQIDGIWMATETEMKTVQGKQRLHTTILKFDNISMKEPLDEGTFTVRRIEKGL